MVSLLKTDHRANGQSRAQSLLVFRSAGQARRIWVRDRQKAYFKVSNRDPHDQRELADLCKIPKFGVYPGPILDEIQSLKKHQCQRPAIHIFIYIYIVDRWSCLMSVVLQFRTIRNSTVAINDQWLLLKPELLWLLIYIYISIYFLINFSSFWMAVCFSIFAQLAPNLRIL